MVCLTAVGGFRWGLAADRVATFWYTGGSHCGGGRGVPVQGGESGVDGGLGCEIEKGVARRALGELNKEWVKYWGVWVGKQEESIGGEWTLGDLLLWGSASLRLGQRVLQEPCGWCCLCLGAGSLIRSGRWFMPSSLILSSYSKSDWHCPFHSLLHCPKTLLHCYHL